MVVLGNSPLVFRVKMLSSRVADPDGIDPEPSLYKEPGPTESKAWPEFLICMDSHICMVHILNGISDQVVHASKKKYIIRKEYQYHGL